MSVPAKPASSRLPPCPICKRPAEPALKPFCSERCADIDLGRWLSDRYAIPTEEDEAEDEGPARRDEPA